MGEICHEIYTIGTSITQCVRITLRITSCPGLLNYCRFQEEHDYEIDIGSHIANTVLIRDEGHYTINQSINQSINIISKMLTH